jgi:hypothetical protein
VIISLARHPNIFKRVAVCYVSWLERKLVWGNLQVLASSTRIRERLAECLESAAQAVSMMRRLKFM